MIYSTCYIIYAVYHTGHVCLYSIPWMLYNSPKYYIAPPVMPDECTDSAMARLRLGTLTRFGIRVTPLRRFQVTAFSLRQVT